MTQPHTDQRKRAIATACYDPGAFVKRTRTESDYGGYDYEPLHEWQTRAVLVALDRLAPDEIERDGVPGKTIEDGQTLDEQTAATYKRAASREEQQRSDT